MNIVERLKNSLEYEYNLSFSERKQLLEEIDRLNNIIDELEKWLNEDEYFNGRKLRKDYITVLVTDVLDKLKELKNGDNNG